jgi:hypothetical protein
VRTLNFIIEGFEVKSIIDIFRKEFPFSFNYVSEKGDIFVLIFEKYSFLQNSDMACSIIVDFLSENKCNLIITVAGGRTGIARLDIFGREKALLRECVNFIEKICIEKGWKLIRA